MQVLVLVMVVGGGVVAVVVVVVRVVGFWPLAKGFLCPLGKKRELIMLFLPIFGVQ